MQRNRENTIGIVKCSAYCKSENRKENAVRKVNRRQEQQRDKEQGKKRIMNLTWEFYFIYRNNM